MAGSYRAQGNLNIAKEETNKQTNKWKPKEKAGFPSHTMRILAKYNESSMYSAAAKKEEVRQGTEVEKRVELFKAGWRFNYFWKLVKNNN